MVEREWRRDWRDLKHGLDDDLDLVERVPAFVLVRMLVAADVALKAAEVERGQLRLDLAEALLHLDECHQRRKAEGEQLRQELHNTQARMKEAQEEVEQLRLKLSDAEQQASNAITWQQAMVRAEGENRLLRAALGDDDGCGGDWLKGRAEKVLGKEVPS